MSDALESLRRYMPEWMARKGVTLLEALPEKVEPWVRETANTLAAHAGLPGRDPWRDAIVERFGAGRRSKEQTVLVDSLSGAVLLVAIQQLPAPVLSSESTTADIRATKELDIPAVKRSRMLGMLEPSLAAFDDAAKALVQSLGD